MRAHDPRRGAGLTLGVLAIATLAGCLGEPEVPERWTRVDVLASNLDGGERFAAGDSVAVQITTAVTYRSILTGFLVAELRASSELGPGHVALDPLLETERERLDMAHHIDDILQRSVTAGRATRAVTGWDHLIQEVTFDFAGRVPGSADSTGAPPVGLFCVVYLGEGDEVELEDGSDSLVVTPFLSDEMEILPVGYELGID